MAPETSTSTAAAPASPELLVIRNPATGDEVGRVPATAPEAVAEVVARARPAQRSWAAMRFAERSAVLRRFHDLMLDETDRLLDTIQTETGKTRRDALGEVVTVAGTIRYYLAHGQHHLRDRRRRGALPGATSAQVIRKPLGVTGLISPWNFPFLLPVGDSVAALLAGNAVVVKPSELTPLSAELGRELLVEAGLAPELYQIVHGGADTAQALIREVDGIGFTGSTAVGRKVAAAAGERLIPCSLELGGKNPMVILADAPVDDAVTGLLVGAFTNTGQTCICVEKVYVESGVYDAVVERAIERIRAMKLGWSLDWDMDMGSLVSRDHLEKVWAHVEDAREKGARFLTGGTLRPDLGATFLEPTLVTGVTAEMRLATEETFGPVVSIEPVGSADEAIERANATRYGLNASVWGGRRAFEVAQRLDTGTANVNATLLAYNTFDVPMGGVKESGLGRRHGEHGILRHTEEQSLVGSFSTGGGFESVLTRMRSERLARAFVAGLRAWRRIPFIR